MALAEHAGNEIIKRRKELDVPGCLRASSVAEYDYSMIVPMWGYNNVEVGAAACDEWIYTIIASIAARFGASWSGMLPRELLDAIRKK